MPTTPIRKVTITSPSGGTIETPVGAYAENILMSDAAGADDLVTALGNKADDTDFTGPTSSEAGTHGLVPAPAVADKGKFLQSDGDWAKPVKEGYLNPSNGKFYEESTYTTEIEAISGLMYIDLNDNKIYRYDTTAAQYVTIGGGGNFLEETTSLPTATLELANKIYLYVGPDTVSLKHGGIYECQADNLLENGHIPSSPTYFNGLDELEAITPTDPTHLNEWVPASGVTLKFLNPLSWTPELKEITSIDYELYGANYAFRFNYASGVDDLLNAGASFATFVLTTGPEWVLINDVCGGGATASYDSTNENLTFIG